MRCSKCATENREGRKFCAECGAPLSARCASCGAENEPAEKFCGECGAALTGKTRAVSAKPPPTKPATTEIHIAPAQADGPHAQPARRKYTPIGHSISLAARLQTSRRRAQL
jgi:hypothetical protein